MAAQKPGESGSFFGYFFFKKSNFFLHLLCGAGKAARRGV
jgi:hypothetical protein